MQRVTAAILDEAFGAAAFLIDTLTFLTFASAMFIHLPETFGRMTLAITYAD